MRIQIHIHPWAKDFMGLFPKALMDRYERSYPGFPQSRTIENLIKDMDEIGVGVSVLLPIDCTVALGKRISNETVTEAVNLYPDRLIGFASVNPRKGKTAMDRMDRTIKKLKLHPRIQEFYPHDKEYYPLYEKCVALDVPVTNHCGFGFGMKHIYGDPIYVDSVAFDFPELPIEMVPLTLDHNLTNHPSPRSPDRPFLRLQINAYFRQSVRTRRVGRIGKIERSASDADRSIMETLY